MVKLEEKPKHILDEGDFDAVPEVCTGVFVFVPGMGLVSNGLKLSQSFVRRQLDSVLLAREHKAVDSGYDIMRGEDEDARVLADAFKTFAEEQGLNGPGMWYSTRAHIPSGVCPLLFGGPLSPAKSVSLVLFPLAVGEVQVLGPPLVMSNRERWSIKNGTACVLLPQGCELMFVDEGPTPISAVQCFQS